MPPRFPHLRRARVVTALVTAGAGLAACGTRDDPGPDAPQPAFGYALPVPLVTTNAGSAVGVATDAAKISARLYPGAFLNGPNGQLLPNADLVTAAPVPPGPDAPADAVDYTVADAATFSDSVPVTCDDFYLAWAAGVNPAAFGSDMPVYRSVTSVDCTPGSRTFRVTFTPGHAGRYRELFGIGQVLPAHTVVAHAGFGDAAPDGAGAGADTPADASGDAGTTGADAAGETAGTGQPDVVSLLSSGDPDTLDRLGAAWRDTFTLATTDPATVPTAGPYRITGRRADGSLTLEPNPAWRGDAPGQGSVVMWPAGVDYRRIIADRQLVIADLPPTVRDADGGDTGFSGAGLRFSTAAGTRVDGLRLSDQGVFAPAENRSAFARCIDRAAVVHAVQQTTGVDVTPTGLRVIAPSHPLAPRLADINGRATAVDRDAAKAALDGATVRIGFLGDISRYAPMVTALAGSCAEAGVTVVPVPRTADDLGQLGVDYDAVLDARSSFAQNPDSPVSVFSPLGDIRRAEEELDTQTATIPLTTEPRAIAVNDHVANVVDNPGEAGLSWNMDRWVEHDAPVSSAEPSASPQA